MLRGRHAGVVVNTSTLESRAMKDALGLGYVGGFPCQLSLNRNAQRPIPAVDFSNTIPKDMMIGAILNDEERHVRLKFRNPIAFSCSSNVLIRISNFFNDC